MKENRKWVVITLADYTDEQLEELVSNAIQSNSSRLRKSLDGTKTILKWDGDTPTVFNVKFEPVNGNAGITVSTSSSAIETDTP